MFHTKQQTNKQTNNRQKNQQTFDKTATRTPLASHSKMKREKNPL